jgi:hypothetical protein
MTTATFPSISTSQFWKMRTTVMCLSQFVLSHLYEQHPMQIIFLSKCGLSFSTGIDLNLPLDEFGAVDFDFVQNLTGTVLSLCFFYLFY